VLRERHLRDAEQAGLPVVTTCYVRSASAVREAAARDATAYLYLVARYGRSGTAPEGGFADLGRVVDRLRLIARAPLAVGFGVRSRADVDRVARTGADAVIVGTAAVEAIDQAVVAGRDTATGLDQFLQSIRD
jgi:tryptophan synthase alpha chain